MTSLMEGRETIQRQVLLAPGVGGREGGRERGRGGGEEGRGGREGGRRGGREGGREGGRGQRRKEINKAEKLVRNWRKTNGSFSPNL